MSVRSLSRLRTTDTWLANNFTPMSFLDFKEKHKVKFANQRLNERQIRERYDNYLSSEEPTKGRSRLAIQQNGNSAENQPQQRALAVPRRAPQLQGRGSAAARRTGGSLNPETFKDPMWLADRGMLAPGVQLSPESTKYICALVDPSNPRFIGCGYPSSGQGPSLKVRNFVRCTMEVGTAGVGIVMASPALGMVNDLGAVSASTAAFTGGASFPNSGAIGMANFKSNSTLGSVKGVAGRIVAASVSISPAGKLIDEAGVITTINAPGGIGLVGVTESEVQTEFWRHAQIHTQTREDDRKFSALWTPTFPNLPLSEEDSASGILGKARVNAGSGLVELADLANAGTDNLGIMVTGATPGFKYFVEFYVHCEYFAGAASGAASADDNSLTQYATPTHSDATALDLVNSSTGTSLNALPKTDSGNSSSSSIINWIGSAAKGVTYFANAMRGIFGSGGGSASDLMSSFSAGMPQLTQGTTIDSLGGFLPASSTAAIEEAPLVEMLAEGGEWVPLLAL